MRSIALALAVAVAGCAALPEQMTITFPSWMRGQGLEGRETAAQPQAQPASGFTFATGELAVVHQDFARQVSARYAAGATAAAVRADLERDGFFCVRPVSGDDLSCERAQPIGNGCSDIFTVTVDEPLAPESEVRRRCPMGVRPPG